MGTVNILLLDQNYDHAEILKKNIEKIEDKFNITHISSISELIPSIKRNTYDIIISEYLFKDYNGKQVLKTLKDENSDIPLVFFTQDTKENILIEAFRDGAKDFFIKDFSITNLNKLSNSIKRLVSEYRANLEKKKMEDIIRENYNQIKNIFSTLEERIFIIDRDYNILFSNERETALNNKCYTTFFNNPDVCDFCIAKELFKKPDRKISIKRELRCEKTGKWFRAITKIVKWREEENALLCILIDISDLKKINENLNKRLKYEKAISIISSRAMMIKDLDNFLNDALEVLGKTTGVSRVYIFKNYDNNRRTLNTHEWTKKNVEPFIGLDADYSDFPYWYNVLSNDGIIMASDIHDLPEEVHEILEMQSIKSILVVPIFVKGEFTGFIGFDECERHKVWEDYEVNLLKATAQIIGARMSYE